MPSAPCPQTGLQMVLGAGPHGCGRQRVLSLLTLPCPLQKRWPAGTQCVTKHDHTKPKAQELAFRKGDMVTIIEAVEVSPAGAGGSCCLWEGTKGMGLLCHLLSCQWQPPLPSRIPPSFPCSETLSPPGQGLVPSQTQRDGAGGAAGGQRAAGAWSHPCRPQAQPHAVSTAGGSWGHQQPS